MREDGRGLKVKGRLFALNTERGQLIYEGLKAGELDSLSIGFRTIDAADEIVRGEPRRRIKEVDLWEVSIVTFPANPKARIQSVKNLALEYPRQLENALRDEGLSWRHARVAAEILQRMLAPGEQDRDSAPLGEVAPDMAAAMQAANAVTGKLISAALRNR
jgi:hypothetical protein